MVASPQANELNEHLYQTVESTMCTICSHAFPPQNKIETSNHVDNCLAIANMQVVLWFIMFSTSPLVQWCTKEI
jgi:hypothetical protein